MASMTNNQTQTIARTPPRKIAAIKASHTVARLHSHLNDYVAEEITVEAAWEYFERMASRNSRIVRTLASDRVTLDIGTRSWIYLTRP